jgi:hypothetical protein
LKHQAAQAMRWIVKTSLDGQFSDDVICRGDPLVPEVGSRILLPLDDNAYVSAIVMEIEINKRHVPAVLRVICTNPDGQNQG